MLIFRFGFIVGSNPLKTIIISLVFALLCLIGLLRFKQESRAEKLWVEQESQYIKDQEWVRSKFPIRVRVINVILKKNDILTMEGLLQVIFFLFYFRNWIN